MTTVARGGGDARKPIFEVHIDGVRYVAAAALARTHNITADYAARLARQGNVVAQLLGNRWYINENSLHDFLVERKQAQRARYTRIALDRRGEYRAAQARTGSATHTDPEGGMPPSAI